MSRKQLPAEITPAGRLLTSAEFHRLADVPPEIEWFANLSNAGTRRIYENAVRDFMRFAGIRRPEEFRIVTRAHVIKWRDELVRRGLGGSDDPAIGSPRSRRCFEYLCEKTPCTHNPVKGVERPRIGNRRRQDAGPRRSSGPQVARAPADDSTRSKRDRAILSTLLFHALRREELCKLKVRDFRHARKGVPHLKVSGKGGETRYVPLHPGTHALIHEYLDAAGHGEDDAGALPGRCATTAPASWTGRSRRTGSISSCAPIRPHSASRSARMLCGRQRPPMHSITRPTSPRCRSGSVTRTLLRRGSMIIGARGPRTVRRSR